MADMYAAVMVGFTRKHVRAAICHCLKEKVLIAAESRLAMPRYMLGDYLY
jgi:hypothetical protein